MRASKLAHLSPAKAGDIGKFSAQGLRKVNHAPLALSSPNSNQPTKE